MLDMSITNQYMKFPYSIFTQKMAHQRFQIGILIAKFQKLMFVLIVTIASLSLWTS